MRHLAHTSSPTPLCAYQPGSLQVAHEGCSLLPQLGMRQPTALLSFACSLGVILGRQHGSRLLERPPTAVLRRHSTIYICWGSADFLSPRVTIFCQSVTFSAAKKVTLGGHIFCRSVTFSQNVVKRRVWTHFLTENGPTSVKRPAALHVGIPTQVEMLL